MMERIAKSSPHPSARVTGVVYLLYYLTAISAEVLVGRSRPVAYDAVNVVGYALYVTLAVLLYYLFKPVNRGISLLAACVSIVGCANEVLMLFHLTPYKINALIFFGPYCLLLGYLILRSTFLPRFLGVLLVLAGVGWLIFMSPLAVHLLTYLKILGFVAELSLMLWLLVKGVNVQRWSEQASASAQHR
jgi:hypothetical protein